MIPALIILAVLIVIGLILYLFELNWRRKHPVNTTETSPESLDEANPDPDNSETEEDDEQCCGLHLVCEKDSLSPMSAEIIYYDDEDLDRFVGRTPESYSPEEVEEFREVLMTLRADDVAGWARSITQRRLELPFEVRDELLMLVNEQRNLAKN
ncbi:MAG: phospholipase [Bacteroides sp.]|nr:phospholipase [Bacteroidales bacterium]MBD5347620.1 phospholipase [Bacteroides sp.]